MPGSVTFIDSNANGRYDENEIIVVTAASGGYDYGWIGVSLGGGALAGVYAGAHTVEALTLAAEWGLISAEAGAVVGPAGVAVGLVVGSVAAIAIYTYQDEIIEGLESATQQLNDWRNGRSPDLREPPPQSIYEGQFFEGAIDYWS